MERAFGVLFSMNRGAPTHGEWVVACLDGAWRGIVGERLAAVSRPVFFKGSKLTIEVFDRAWEDAVKNLRPELLKKVQAATSLKVEAVELRCRRPPAAGAF